MARYEINWGDEDSSPSINPQSQPEVEVAAEVAEMVTESIKRLAAETPTTEEGKRALGYSCFVLGTVFSIIARGGDPLPLLRKWAEICGAPQADIDKIVAKMSDLKESASGFRNFLEKRARRG